MCALLISIDARSVHAELPRVGALDPSLRELLTESEAASPTLRALIDRLEQSDLIVHIEWRPRRSIVGGMLRVAAQAGGNRCLRGH